MALFSTCDGSPEIPDYVTPAVVRHAERVADLVAGFLKFIDFPLASDAGENQCSGLSAATLLELGAFLLRVTWGHSGVDEFLPAETPSLDIAARAIQKRIADGAVGTFDGQADLHRAVSIAWFNSMAWDCPIEHDADFAVSAVDEDVLVDAIAGLIWRHRHDQKTCIEKTSQTVDG
jgi:hypothetical protein